MVVVAHLRHAGEAAVRVEGVVVVEHVVDGAGDVAEIRSMLSTLSMLSMP